jgi:penicillin-binding protein 2
MYGVVNEGGTAGASRLQGIEFCGKTGSAQVMSNNERGKLGKAASKGKDNAWFVGFAPRRDPEIVISVLVEGGEHGASAAAPIARDIVKAYYDKKNKKNPGEVTAKNQPTEQMKKSPATQTAEASKAALKAEEASVAVGPESGKPVE